MDIFLGMTDAEIMRALGGYREVAAHLGQPPTVVHKWCRRGFPARYWPAVVRLAEDKGLSEITLETLERPMWRRRELASA